MVNIKITIIAFPSFPLNFHLIPSTAFVYSWQVWWISFSVYCLILYVYYEKSLVLNLDLLGVTEKQNVTKVGQDSRFGDGYGSRAEEVEGSLLKYIMLNQLPKDTGSRHQWPLFHRRYIFIIYGNQTKHCLNLLPENMLIMSLQCCRYQVLLWVAMLWQFGYNMSDHFDGFPETIQPTRPLKALYL